MDVATKKHAQLAIVFNFFCEQENRVESQFFKLKLQQLMHATTLFSCINSLFEKEEVPLDN